MKVCTDACIQGALAAVELSVKKCKTVLDIGAGTGLLSLMLAQINLFHTQDAIEINKEAYEQAKQNGQTSIFENNIHLLNEDVRNYQPSYRYDFIISNPPFYENDLESPSIKKRQALHSSHLSYDELIVCIDRLLAPEGFFCLMIPYVASQKLIKKAASKSFYPYRIYNVKHSANRPFFRSIFFFDKQRAILKQDEFIIRDGSNRYTNNFKSLLSPYYLHL